MQYDGPNPDEIRRLIAELTATRNQAEKLLRELKAALEELTGEASDLEPPSSDDRD